MFGEGEGSDICRLFGNAKGQVPSQGQGRSHAEELVPPRRPACMRLGRCTGDSGVRCGRVRWPRRVQPWRGSLGEGHRPEIVAPCLVRQYPADHGLFRVDHLRHACRRCEHHAKAAAACKQCPPRCHHGHTARRASHPRRKDSDADARENAECAGRGCVPTLDPRAHPSRYRGKRRISGLSWISPFELPIPIVYFVQTVFTSRRLHQNARGLRAEGICWALVRDKRWVKGTGGGFLGPCRLHGRED